jgi:hypothetical protein
MNTLILWFRVQTLIVLSAAAFWLALPGVGQTLQTFGHGSLATGASRPLLVVLADFATGGPFGHYPAYYDCVFHDGSRECGLFSGSFAFVRDGVNSALSGEIVIIRPGNYNELMPMTIDKHVTLRASDGNVSIGIP